MENKIKVTVEYEKPEMSKFEALLNQYKIAEEIANATEVELTPLIQEGGKAKYIAICEQLTVIGKQFREYCIVTKKKYYTHIWTKYRNSCGSDVYFSIGYTPDNDTLYYLFNGYSLDRGYGWDFMNFERNSRDLIGEGGVVTRWNRFNIISELQQELERYITNAIKDQTERVSKVQTHLKNIQN